MKFTLSAAIMSLFLATALADGLPPHIPTDVGVIARLDYDAVRDHEIVKQLKDVHHQAVEDVKRKLRIWFSFDVEKVDTAWLLGKSLDEGAVILKGSFDVERIVSALKKNPGLKTLEAKGCRVVAVPVDKKDSDKMIVILNDGAIVVGDRNPLFWYLEALQGNASDLQRKTRGMIRRAIYDAPSHLSVVFLRAPWEGQSGADNLDKQMRYGALKLNLNDALAAELIFKMKKATQAKVLSHILKGFLMAQLDKPGQTGPVKRITDDLKDRLNVETRNGSVRITSTVSGKTLRNLIEETSGVK